MNERELFEAALEISDTASRKAFLDNACSGQPELRARLDELLESHAVAGEFLATPAVPPGPAKFTDVDGQSAPAAAAAEFEKTHGYSENPHAGDDEVSLEFLSPSDKPDSLGRLGHYEVHEVLGHGAFGIVLKAFDEKLHRMVAIKVVSPELAKSSPPRKRFLREARSAAAIRHEHVVAIHAVEEQPIPYLVMEYIPGITMEQALHDHGPLDVADVLRLGQQIAAGLAAAHAQGLIHRDIKPSNILLENGLSGRVKITDFGLARAADDASMTQSGTIAGTPMYMSPEQATSGDIDQRSDLFSLGSVLYVMVSGRPPFRAATTLAVLKRVVEDTPRPIPTIIADTPNWLCAIIGKLQAKQPNDRFATAKEVAELLGRCLVDLQANRPVQLPADIMPAPVIAPLEPTPLAPVVIPQAVAKPNQQISAPERRWPTIAAAALILLVGLGLTEATGVTKLTSTVIRLTTGSGILVIEADDPSVKVTIDGEEVRIQGAGVEQLSLKPGQYQVAAVKNGKPVSQQLVTITRGGREVVRVALEGIVRIDTPVSGAPAGSAQAAPDRRAAEWVLSIGGHVYIKENGEERLVRAVDELPHEAFDLTRVDLTDNTKVSEAGFANFKNCRNLTGLNLHSAAPVSDESLANFKDCKNLTFLELYYRGGSDCRVSDAGLVHFRNCKDLIHLVLANSLVTDAGLAYFKDCKNLQGLSLQWTKVSDAGLVHFKDCKNLNSLVVGATQVTDAGLAHFKDHKNITHLDVGATRVTDAGLSNFKNCMNLTYLDLHVTSVSDLGLERLTDFPNLSGLYLTETKVTEAGVKKLSAAMPGCKIEWDGGVIEPGTGWHGWPTDAPPPAIAPFDAEQAKQHQAAWAKYLGVPVEYTNSLGMKFRLIPPGEFMMGSTQEGIEAALKDVGDDKHWQECVKSEAPQHKVILTKPIYLGIHEVTQVEYEKVVGTNPSHFASTGAGKEAVVGIDTHRHPVERVSWNHATEFCAKLSQQEQLKPFYFRAGEAITPLNGTGYRLPSEAEWEFAVRAGTTSLYWNGDADDGLEMTGWFNANSGLRSHIVGELKANPFGMFDVHGNVWELVQDGWDKTFYSKFLTKPATDPHSNSSARSLCVVRGGLFDSSAIKCRVSYRHAFDRELCSYRVGFRVSLPIDAVRQALKVDAPKIVKPGGPVGANGDPVAEHGRSAWDDLDPAQIPEEERAPRQPEGLVAVLGQQRRRVWNTLRSSSVSADGTQFMLTTDDGLYLFARDPKQPARFFTFTGGISSATFLPDGRIAAFVVDGGSQALRIFAKPRGGEPLEKLSTTNANYDASIRYPTVSSDGCWLAAYEYTDNFSLWRLDTAAPQRAAKFVLPKQNRNVLPGSFSPDAQWFCFTDNSELRSVVHLIDLQGDTPHEATVLNADADETSDAPAKGFEHAAFLSDGRLATADRNGHIWFWKINDGGPQRVGSIHEWGPMLAAAESLRLITDVNVLFRAWNLTVTPPALFGSSAPVFPADNMHLLALAIAPNGETVFTGQLNGAVRFWNVSSAGVIELDPLFPNPRRMDELGRLQVVNRLLCTSTEGSRVGIWRPTREGMQSVPVDNSALRTLGSCPARRQLIVESVGGGVTVLSCDADRTTPARHIPGDNIQSAALDDEGRRLAIGRHDGKDSVVELWSWESDDLPARKLSEIKLSQVRAKHLAFAETGRTLIGHVGLHIQIWDVKEDQLIPRCMLPSQQYYQLAVSPDGQTLASESAGKLELWNLKSDLTQPTASFWVSHNGAVAFSPDGRSLAASFWENGASAGVQIINLATGVVEKRLAFPGRVHELTFTDDSRHLITGNANATIYVVRLEPAPAKLPAK